jgi:hypothetical protein
VPNRTLQELFCEVPYKDSSFRLDPTEKIVTIVYVKSSTDSHLFVWILQRTWPQWAIIVADLQIFLKSSPLKSPNDLYVSTNDVCGVLYKDSLFTDYLVLVKNMVVMDTSYFRNYKVVICFKFIKTASVV